MGVLGHGIAADKGGILFVSLYGAAMGLYPPFEAERVKNHDLEPLGIKIARKPQMINASRFHGEHGIGRYLFKKLAETLKAVFAAAVFFGEMVIERVLGYVNANVNFFYSAH
jgi:hypothetical protein